MLITRLLLVLEVGVIGFDLGLLLQGQTRTARPKVLIIRLLLVLEVCNVKPTYRKSWAGNLLIWSDLTVDPSFKVKRRYPNLKMLIARLLLVLEVCNVIPTYRKLWARNHLMWSDLTLGPSFSAYKLLFLFLGVRVNNFFSKTTRPRDMLFFFKRYLIYRG